VRESAKPDCRRPAPGMLIARRADLISVGGMNSDLSGWGFEDLDLLIRLRRRGVRLVPCGDGIHLTHGDDKRNIPPGLTQAQSDLRNRAMSYARLQRDELDGTMARDVAAWLNQASKSSAISKRHWGMMW